jgi:hypothetical protein
MGLHSRLAEKEHEKRVYERDLAECEDAYGFINQKRRMLEEDIYESDRHYDMTSAGDWYGELERDADNLRNENCSQTNAILRSTSKHLDDLLRVMERIAIGKA